MKNKTLILMVLVQLVSANASFGQEPGSGTAQIMKKLDNIKTRKLPPDEQKIADRLGRDMLVGAVGIVTAIVNYGVSKGLHIDFFEPEHTVKRGVGALAIAIPAAVAVGAFVDYNRADSIEVVTQKVNVDKALPSAPGAGPHSKTGTAGKASGQD